MKFLKFKFFHRQNHTKNLQSYSLDMRLRSFWCSDYRRTKVCWRKLRARKIERVAGPVNRTVTKILDFLRILRFSKIFRFPYLLEADIEIETLIYKLIIFQTSFWRFQPFFLEQFHFRWIVLTLSLYDFDASPLHRKCNLWTI